MKKFNRGFTLIELLVVIAIIGILSSVVLSALNQARSKGANSNIKSNLSNARAQGELYYVAMNESYSGVCGTTNASDGTKPINAFFIAAHTQSGVANQSVLLTSVGSATQSVCHAATASPWAWAAAVPLKVAEGANIYWCVDSTGFSGGRQTALGANATVCPAT